MKGLLTEAAHAWRVMFTAARNSFSIFIAGMPPALFFGSALPRYILQSAFFVLLARFAGGDDAMRYAFIGNIIQIVANMGTVGVSSVVEAEKWVGTLPFLIAIPSPRLPVLLGSAVAELSQGLVAVFAALIGCTIFFGSVIDPLRLLAALPVILLVTVTIGGLGLLIGAVTLPGRIGVLVSNTASYVMMILCGTNFPITVYPEWLQTICRTLPMTNGLMAIRQLIDGATYSEVLPLIGLEVLIGLVYFAIGYLAFIYHLNVARQKGTVELF